MQHKKQRRRNAAAARTLGVLMCLATGSAYTAQARAQESASQTIVKIDLPAQELARTLVELGRDTGLSVLFDPAQVAGLQAPAIRGEMSARQALDRALAGTSLAATLRGQVATVRPSVTSLAPVTITADAIDEYIADRPSSVATKTSLPPRQTPFTVNQASAELMQDRNDANVYDTLEYFAGVTTNSNNGDSGQSMSRDINVRGFSTGSTGQLLINGQRTYSGASAARSADSMESIELLRGPAALYYGAAEPGGIINYQYKRPKAQDQYILRTHVDDQGSYGGMADMTGPLNKEGTLLYRLVGSYSRYEDDQDHIWQRPKSVLAALTYAPNARLDTTLTYERMDMQSVPEQENNVRITRASRPDYGKYYDVPRDFFWGSKDDRVQTQTDTVLWDLGWRPSQYFNVNAYATYQQTDGWWQNTRLLNAGNGPDAAGNVQRYVSGRQSASHEWSGGLDISGSVDTGDFNHAWLTGFGYGHTTSRSSGRVVAAETRPGQPYYPGPINIYDPQYSDWGHRDRIRADPLGYPTRRDDVNLYFQDTLTLPNDKTRLMLAMGWSRYDSRAYGAGATTRSRVSKWSPRVAIMHDITPATTVYASYGDSFSPQSSLTLLDMSGNYIMDAIQGKQYEVGLKQDLFDARAMFTAAVFRIDKTNMPIQTQDDSECDPDAAPAPGTPGGTDGTGDCRYGISGLERSQGLELTLSGMMTDWWAAAVSYSYLDTEYRKTDDEWSRGRSKAYTPKHSLSLWNKVRVYNHADRGRVHVGLGWRVWSKSHGTWRDPATAPGYHPDTRTDWNPGYGLVDLGLFYENQLANGMQLKMQLNASNLFDKTYYDRRRFASGSTLVWGNGRRVTLTTQLTF
ncbi:siderophore receptor [Bordetella ansorpii]|uniref:Siderophore receptor n=1 Tax=Bordetella ansorpii TaxID=288768 RepID=A0A157PI92_9BORD|nr:TonB-dependent receptor [Bordetella ansorpii]SAI33345.1 siderophore receptor [Bordetella ansorpii]